MIALAKYKQLLGNEGENLTDAEVEELRDAQYRMARIAFEMWSKEKNIASVERITRNN